jgi:hypothetical protein
MNTPPLDPSLVDYIQSLDEKVLDKDLHKPFKPSLNSDNICITCGKRLYLFETGDVCFECQENMKLNPLQRINIFPI